MIAVSWRDARYWTGFIAGGRGRWARITDEDRVSGYGKGAGRSKEGYQSSQDIEKVRSCCYRGMDADGEVKYRCPRVIGHVKISPDADECNDPMHDLYILEWTVYWSRMHFD